MPLTFEQGMNAGSAATLSALPIRIVVSFAVNQAFRCVAVKQNRLGTAFPGGLGGGDGGESNYPFI